MAFESVGTVGPENENFSISLRKQGVVLAQLCHMPLAEGSGKTAVKYEEDPFF